MTEFCEIQKLAELLAPKKNDEDTDDESQENPNLPGKKLDKPKNNPYAKIGENKEKRPEIFDEDTFLLVDDERANDVGWKKPTPKYDIRYKQQVTSSDVFLQMGAKNPSTASCEDMVITVELPGEHFQNMDLKIFEQRLELTSPKYELCIPLPHPIDPKQGNAQWDGNGDKLIITLRMDREFDFVNF